MSNPTSNFGWQMPTNSDLVTDLPADFEVFGQGVDTTLADLKGGTSGQILSKNTNADMDFVWINNDQGDITGVTATSPLTGGGTSGAITVGIQAASTTQSGAVQLTDSTSSTSTTTAATPNSVKTSYDLANAAIPKSLVDAKGDIVTATADNTPSRKAVGSNGQMLIADSSQSDGLLWANQPSAAFKNALINGAMDIWQRGTSFTNPGTSGTVFSADRWVHYFSGNATVTQETTFKPDTSTYSMKITATASSGGNDTYQLIEQLNMEQFRGKEVTYSVKLAGTATLVPQIVVAYSTTANDNLFNTNTAIGGGSVLLNPTLSASSFQTYAIKFTVPATAKTLRLGISSGTMANTNVFYIAEAQLELGSVPTPFSRAGGTIQGELAACQRYYWRVNASEGSVYSPICYGYSKTATLAIGMITFPVKMRVSPTAIDYSTIALLYANGVVNAMTSVALDLTNPAAVTFTGTIPTATASIPGWISTNNSSSAYLGFSAEL